MELKTTALDFETVVVGGARGKSRNYVKPVNRLGVLRFHDQGHRHA